MQRSLTQEIQRKKNIVSKYKEKNSIEDQCYIIQGYQVGGVKPKQGCQGSNGVQICLWKHGNIPSGLFK